MTSPLDKKGHDASTQALLNAFPMADKIAAMYAEVAIRAYLSAVTLPDELEGSGLVNDLRSASRKVTALKEYTTLAGAAKTTLHRLAETSARAADALSQAHSTIAALRAKLDEARTQLALKSDILGKELDARRVAEAEVKRLTEEKEALRGVLREALYAITEIDNAHKVVRKIRAILTQENADGQ